VTVLREGYSLSSLRADLMAGLTVAIVALPLSMAIAIGSHATPAQGLYTSVVGGFVVSALSGSPFQIGGPAGAFGSSSPGTRAGCFWLESRQGFPNQLRSDSTCWLGGGQQGCRSLIRKTCVIA
jgi:hypothetical protein